MEYTKARDALYAVHGASSELPKSLFHYTSPDAAFGILSGKEMWASSAAFMNDTSEMLYTVDIANTLIGEMIKSAKYQADVIEFLNRLKWNLQHAVRRAYVISFTELSDALSQWRAYCPPSGGYAVVFPFSLLTSLAPSPPKESTGLLDKSAKNGFRLLQCVYEPARHKEIITQAILGCISEYEYFVTERASTRRAHNQYTWTIDTPSRFALDCAMYIQEVALGIKHKGFEEEKEWRLVFNFRIEGSSPDRADLIFFRPSPKGIMPYMKLSLEEPQAATTQPPPALSVVIGPCSNPTERQESLKFFMLKLGYDWEMASLSKTPYKTW